MSHWAASSGAASAREISPGTTGRPAQTGQPLPDFREALRPFQGRTPKTHALRFHHGDALRLSLPDELPLRLSHITEQLQNDVGDQRPGEIPIFSGIQQGHIQHDNGRALLFGNDPPLLQNLIVISAQAVNALDHKGMGLLKLADKYSVDRLEAACCKVLTFTATPSYKSIKNILDAGSDRTEPADKAAVTDSHTSSEKSSHALTRGADYYRR